MVDSIKSSDQQWAKNHFRLNIVVKQMTAQATKIDTLEKENSELKAKVAALEATERAPAHTVQPRATAETFNKEDGKKMKAEMLDNMADMIKRFEAMIAEKVGETGKKTTYLTHRP
jgi:cell division septum initiation protein DivIVA